MLLRLIIFTCCVLLPMAAQSQYAELLHKPYSARYQALHQLFESILREERDSAGVFKDLDQLAAYSRQEGDEALALEAELWRCDYYISGKQPDFRQVEPALRALIREADEEGLVSLSIRARQKLGYFYLNKIKKYGPGFEEYLTSYELLKEQPLTVIPDKQELISNLASEYFRFRDFDNARRYFMIARNMPPSFKKRIAISLQNSLGLIAEVQSSFDSAEYYYRKAYRLAELNQDSTWMGISAGNLGSVYATQGRYREAEPLLEFDFKQSLKAGETDNGLNALRVMVRMYLKQGRPIEAGQKATFARQLLKDSDDPYTHLKDIYYALARWQQAVGNLNLALRYTDSAFVVVDSLESRRVIHYKNAAEQKVALERYNTQMQETRHKEKLRRYGLYAGVGLLTLLGIIIILVINRKRLIHKQRQVQLQSENEIIVSELESAVQQLDNFTHDIREKNKLIEQYSAQIRKHSQEPAQEQQARKEVLDQLLKATLLTEDQWDKFRVLFERVHSGYQQRLREKLPNLSPSETRFFVLSKLNLTPKEMAAMLGIGADTIRSYRFRLRKKFNITTDTGLDDLIHGI